MLQYLVANHPVKTGRLGHVDVAAKKFLKIVDQAHLVEKTSIGVEFDQEVNITLVTASIIRHGSEHAQVVCTMPFGYCKYLIALFR